MNNTSGDGAEITRVVSQKPLTKAYGVAADGAFEKGDAPGLSRATVERVPASRAASLGSLLAATKSNEAFVLGSCQKPGDRHPLVVKEALSDNPDAVARTDEFFAYRPGSPAWLGLDLDVGQSPDDLRDRVEAAGGYRRVLGTVIPGLDQLDLVARPSSSSGIRNRKSGKSTGLRGLHIYIRASDGSDARRVVKAIHGRLVLAGFGWPFITRAGTVQVRSIVDTVASGNGSRLWYEADAILVDPALEHVPGGRKIVVQPGSPLDTSAIPDLTSLELERLRQVAADIRSGAREPAEVIKAHRERELGANFQEVGRTPADYPIIELTGAHPIQLDDGRVVRVIDLLAEPQAFHRLTCADPLEPEYNGGRNLAVIFTLPSPGRRAQPQIFSQAHGGQLYVFRLTAAEVIQFIRDKEHA